MSSQTWTAFVINQSETEYTIISERDKKYYTLPLPIQQGNIVLPDSVVVNIQEQIFTPHKLFMACKQYQYDILRKRKQYEKRTVIKQEETNINPFKNGRGDDTDTTVSRSTTDNSIN